MLLKGVPGTAKTLMAKTLAHLVQVQFTRVQFTPDLMPSDILGTNVFDLNSSSFRLKKGPIFTQILLADEINRAPAKTQSALLEAMEERQVNLDGECYRLEPPFMVIATQNPVEYEGTYPLPEAQLDRFLFKVLTPYIPFEEGSGGIAPLPRRFRSSQPGCHRSAAPSCLLKQCPKSKLPFNRSLWMKVSWCTLLAWQPPAAKRSIWCWAPALERLQMF